MRIKVKNIAMVVCSMLMAIALVFGITTLNAKANDPVPETSISLVDGASLRINAEKPSLIFTANVQNLDEDATYGVLVVEESLLRDNQITEDYFTSLDELGLTYEKIVCRPFESEGAHKIKAYFLVDPADFTVEYAAVAFIEKDGEYTYTELTENNVRSVAYVAEKSLEEEAFPVVEEATLNSWTEDVSEYDANNTVASINVDKMNVPGENGAEIVSFITSTYYSGGSIVEFDVFVPLSVQRHFEANGKSFGDCWISVCWTDDIANTDLYAHAYGNGRNVNGQITPGKWSHVTVSIPGERNVYLYVTAAKSEWGGNSLLIDNFKVTEDGIEYLEDFEGELEVVDVHGNPNAMDGGESAPVSAEEIVKLVKVPVTVSAEEEFVEGEYSAKLYIDSMDASEGAMGNFVTKESYAIGTEVSFMYYIPEDVTPSYWWVALASDPYSIPSQYDGQVKALSKDIVGEWVTVNLTLESAGHIFIFGSLSEWGGGYALIDNFTVNGVTETFNNGLDASMFIYNESAVQLGEGIALPEEPEFVPGEYAAKLYIDNMQNPAGGAQGNFVTRESYEAGTEVSFVYYIPEDVTPSYWWVGLASDPYLIESQYDGQIRGLSKDIVGEWVTVNLTLESAGHIFIFGSISEWGGGYALIDNFAINGEVVEDFTNGLENSAFIVNEDAVSLGDGYIVPEEPEVEPGEHALKYTFNVGMDEKAPFITEEAFEAGSTVEFMYYIPAGASTSWLIWAWTADVNSAPYYAQLESPATGADLSVVTGSWEKISVTLPAEGGPFHIYLASAVGGWQLAEGGNAYMLIDNITVNGEIVADFNNGLEDSGVIVTNEVCVDLAQGEGYVEEAFEPGEYAMKLSAASQSGFIPTATTTTFPAGSTVTFKYFIPEGTTTQWWRTGYKSTEPDRLPNQDYYDAPYQYNTQVVGAWTTQTVTLPTDADSYYIFFVFEDGGWAGTYGEPYVLIDEFAINGEVVENFNNGLGIFEARTSGVALGDGYIAPELPELPENGAAKITIDLISGTASTPSFITTQKYVSDGSLVVTFDYYMSGNTNSKWWAFFWTNDNTVASVYAHVENNKDNNNGIDLPKNVQDEWATASVTIPAGEWYFYIGGAIGEWNGGYVIIDNFKIGDIVTETFDNTNNAVNERDYGIFVDNRDSKPDAVTLVEGKPASEEPDFIDGEHAAMLDVDSDVEEYVLLASKEAYAGGSVISFKYYLTGTPADANWWGIAYSTSNEGISIYDAAGANKFGLSKIAGTWVNVEFTLPEGADYYVYFGHCIGGWNGYILIDDFAVNGELVENFNGNPVDWAFALGQDYVSYTDGYVEEVFEPGEYSMKYVCNASGETVSQVTANAYEAGSTISFMYYIAEGTVTSWWGIAWSTTNTGLDIYATASSSTGYQPSKVTGEWTLVSFTLPAEGGPFYLYFGAEVGAANGRWMLNGENATILIDNFTVNGELVEDFTNGLEGSAFTVLVDGTVGLGEGYVSEEPDPEPDPEPVFPGDYAAVVYAGSLTGGLAGFVTEEAYPAGSTIFLRSFVPSGDFAGWWSVAYTTDPTNVSMYDNKLGDLSTTRDQWRDRTFTLPAEGGPYYILIVGATGENPSRYGFIDNVKITTPSGDVYYEDFSNGLEGSLFNVNDANAIKLSADGEGCDLVDYVPFVAGEHAVEFDFSSSFDCVSTTFMTKDAVAQGGDTVTLRYYIPESSTAGDWWFFGWSTTRDGASFWVPNQMVTVNGGLGLGTTKGEWITTTIKIPTDSEGYAYYLYVCGYQNWSGPIYIDDVVVSRNGEVVVEENFNGNPNTWIFAIGNESYVSYGEGYVEEVFEPGEYSMKYVCNASGETVSQVTANAYEAGSTISFRYYIAEGTVTSWWGIAWSTTNTGLDIYATASSSTGYQPSKVTGEWTLVSFTLPAEGGPFYLYFGAEVGAANGRWMLNGENATILIDNFTVNGELVEDFTNGLEGSAFTVLVDGTVGLGDGYIAPETPDSYGAKITVDLISSTASTPSFITKEKYVSDGTLVVTFDFYMTGNTIPKWWTFNWTSDNTVANIYAFVEPTDTNKGQELPYSLDVQGSWQTVSVTIPEGEWYFYFAGAIGEWGEGYVIIDNFKIGDVVTETFENTNNANDPKDYGIFVDNRDSKPNAITLVEANKD